NQLLRPARRAVQRARKTRQILIRPRRRNAEPGMNQDERRPLHRGKKVQGLDVLAATRAQAGFGLQKEWNVRAERRGVIVKRPHRKWFPKNLVQPEQRRGRIAAAAAETRRELNFFLEMNT